MNVLIVGGGGYVGSNLRPALEAEHQCRHFDINPIPGADPSSIVGDVRDVPLARKACQGMDAVVYLAMGGLKDKSAIIRTSFDVNVQGVYVFLDAAAQAGVRTFVYTSTLSVYQNPHRPMTEDIPPDQFEAYGLTKYLGEVICERAARQFPRMCIVALRLMYPRSEKDFPKFRYDPALGAENMSALGPNDARRLYLAAVACRKPGVHIVQATGDLEQLRYPHTRVQELLGWLPRGD